MGTLTLHPIDRGFALPLQIQNTKQFMVFELAPDHLPTMLRREYRFLRTEGTSRRAARWHVHRMITMLMPSVKWHADYKFDPDESEEPEPIEEYLPLSFDDSEPPMDWGEEYTYLDRS